MYLLLNINKMSMRNVSSRFTYLYFYLSISTDRLKMLQLSPLWVCIYNLELQSISKLFSCTVASCIHKSLILFWPYPFFIRVYVHSTAQNDSAISDISMCLQAWVAIYNKITFASGCLSIYIFHYVNNPQPASTASDLSGCLPAWVEFYTKLIYA